MSKSLQDIRDLFERLQHGLLVIRSRRLESVQCSAAFRFPHAAIEDRLGQTRRDAPYKAGRVEEIAPVQRCRTDTGRKRDGGVELCRSDSDLGGIGMKLSLGGSYVRAL